MKFGKFAVDFLSVYAALIPVMMAVVLYLQEMGVKITLKKQLFIMYLLNLIPVLWFLIFLADFNGPIIIRICFAWPIIWIACLAIIPVEQGLIDLHKVLLCTLAGGISSSIGGIILSLYATSCAYKDEKVLVNAVIMAIFAIGASIAYIRGIKKMIFKVA